MLQASFDGYVSDGDLC